MSIQGLPFQVHWLLYICAFFLRFDRSSSIRNVRKHCVSENCPDGARYNDMKVQHSIREKFMSNDNIQKPHLKLKCVLLIKPFLRLESRLEALCKNNVGSLCLYLVFSNHLYSRRNVQQLLIISQRRRLWRM
ncbi:uncharacterized protein EV420DRAFT_1038003 [Desarmillaria tabescens]|uniref:Secreted protein n=1 Tax=Armillaria tabescens TaxID=1929756 RepID=A0AA39TRT1_ARMTA|nr:uncharacterized protein EV420DRAFT_1038003 [Desarmillaria tabescens]KAK0464353.1 hypothetical protein EV420DRAFT_1038003 [Desarmillaria tabescens]